MLLNGEKIRQNLGGVVLVGQPVPHRHTGVLCQQLHPLLTEASVLDAVEHPAQHFGRVLNALLLADLGGLGVQIHRVHPQVRRRHLKAAAGAGAGLFKNQGDVLALKQPVGDTGLLLRLQFGGQSQQLRNLCRGEIQQGQKISAFQ